MKTVIAIQARLSSTRLPEKILAEVGGKPMLAQLFRRCNAVRTKKTKVVVACPESDEEKIFASTGIVPVTGPEEDVLTRLLNAAHYADADRLVRVTADCPLMCPRLIEEMLKCAADVKEPCVTNTKVRRFPNGLDCEVYSVPFLEDASPMIKGADREWFYSYLLKEASDAFYAIVNPDDLSRKYRITVDYPEDLELVRKVYEAMGRSVWAAQEVISWLEMHPSIRKSNLKYADEQGARP